jgi:hypothetical protein
MKHTLFFLCFFAAFTISINADAGVGVRIKAWKCGYPNEKDVIAILEGNTLTITGKGKMKNYAYDKVSPWFNKCDSIKIVVIQSGVTSIGNEAFRDCSRLTSVTIPNSVTSIGNNAFGYCGLTSVTIPNSVTSIEEDAFRYSELTSVIIPNSVTSIGNNAFEVCSRLTSVTIPNSVTSIGNYAFALCTSLTSITIPNSVTSIGNHAFQGCSLTSVTIPNSITSIRNDAFRFCSSLTSVTIPNSVTSIGNYAFANCSKLTSVTIMSVNPPEIFSTTFSTKIVLYVPDNAVEAYQKDEVWKTFKMTTQVAEQKQQKQQEKEIPETTQKSTFTYFAKNYVEPRISNWQKKGEFEKTSDWQQRVNETTRKAMISKLTKEAERRYIATISQDIKFKLSLGDYDADNEVFLINSDQMESKMLVSVPMNQAQYFKTSWGKLQYTPQYFVENDQLALAEMRFKMPNGQVYKYSNQASLNYRIASVDYNFEPITIDTDNSGSKKGNQTISTVKVSVGKSDVDMNVPVSGATNDKIFAVIIANENYKKEDIVDFALNDGKLFRDYCEKTLGIPVNQIHLVEDATLNDIRGEIEWLKKVADAYKETANIVFYYNGHGIPDYTSNAACLLPVDGYGSEVTTGYRLSTLYAQLGALQVKSITVFLDACFSGAQKNGKMLASLHGKSVTRKIDENKPSGNTVVFAASANDETAYPYKEKGHGLFTYFLLKKLQESKGNVTLGELGDFITTNVSQQSIVVNSKSQTPTVIPSAALGETWQNKKLK